MIRGYKRLLEMSHTNIVLGHQNILFGYFLAKDELF